MTLNNTSYHDYLRNIYFFSDLTEDQLLEISAMCHELTCATGDILCWEGSVGDRFFIILDGIFEVWSNYNNEEKKSLLGIHCAGHLIGEMSLLDDLPRSATIRAQTPARLLYITADDFKTLLRNNNAVCLCVLRSVSLIVRNSNAFYVNKLTQRNNELEAACRELDRAQKRAIENERLSVLGRFSSMILHDIRNPLAVLKNRLDLLPMYNEDKEKFAECTAAIKRDVERMESLTGEFLDYARGDIRLNMGICSLFSLLDRLTDAVAERMTHSKTQLCITRPVNQQLILDSERILRALINVVDNARKASAAGQTINVVAEIADGTLILSVTDSGCGIPPDALPHVFEPFYSVLPGGTGLGMLVVKNVIEAHHGTVAINSVEHEGTTVTLKIPVVA